MDLNGKAFKGIRSYRMISFALGLILVGLVFAAIGIYLLINPSAAETPNTILEIVFIVVGLLAAVGGVFMIIKAVKDMRKKPLSEEEVKANSDRINASEPQVENVKNTKLFFHFGGKMNQSYFVEDKNGKSVYECRLIKFNPFGADTFDFVNVSINYTKTIKMGKTVTAGEEGGFGGPSTSRFKIDGVMCWDYLRERGYEIRHKLEGRAITRYDLVKFGNIVASLVPADRKDPFNEQSTSFLRMGKGVFRLEIADAKLEDVVMAAFIVSRTEIVE